MQNILSGFLGCCSKYFNKEMGLSGKMVRDVEIKSDGDVFHEIFRYRPHHISTMSPGNIQNVDLHEGDWGTVGSVIFWNYTHDGKEKTAKEVIEAIDEEKKLVRFKVVEGDLLQLYKTFTLTVHVDTKGENNLVTWTLEYEKLNGDVEDPTTLMDVCIVVTKDIETHHLK
ncbi:kirola-like isoform X1 [Rhododendron vialii]|uniref:kirola-like isoform X1 n=1 Tax=Rhododendron vialii TaxID=182163 RepID=UPI00265E9C75|nr:kirola-like isoform X1 [Rhododendron vialii]